MSAKHIVKMITNVKNIKPRRFITYLNMYMVFFSSVLLFSDLWVQSSGICAIVHSARVRSQKYGTK